MSGRWAKRGVGVAICALAACSGGPRSQSYMLRAASETVSAEPLRQGLPLLRLETVQIPDYLDGHELLLRRGDNGLAPSPTGHWRERLSAGITEALAADLGNHLAGQWVSSGRTDVAAALRLRVTIERFDVWPDGHCVLVANWSIAPMPLSISTLISSSMASRSPSPSPSADAPASPAPPVIGRGRFEAAVGGAARASDAEVVASMGEAVDALAARIAVTAGDGGAISR